MNNMSDERLALHALLTAAQSLCDAACDLTLAVAFAGSAALADDAVVLAEAIEAELRATESVLARHRR